MKRFNMEISRLFRFFMTFILLFFFVDLLSAEECPSCGSLIEGDPYNEGMVKGITTITKNPGNPCTQTITCSRVDASIPDGLVQISINAFGEPQAVEFEFTTASLTVECGSQGKYIMLGFPEFPLTNTIQCESTPGLPTTTPKTTTTTTKTTTKPPCPEGGTWSTWSSPACNDTCGFCGVKVQTRQCISAASGCPCIGPTEQFGARCGDSVCPFPRGSCCLDVAKRAVVGGKIKCMLL